jgi:hypothetical protein
MHHLHHASCMQGKGVKSANERMVDRSAHEDLQAEDTCTGKKNTFPDPISATEPFFMFYRVKRTEIKLYILC